jgi:hypothetical protein
MNNDKLFQQILDESNKNTLDKFLQQYNDKGQVKNNLYPEEREIYDNLARERYPIDRFLSGIKRDIKKFPDDILRQISDEADIRLESAKKEASSLYEKGHGVPIKDKRKREKILEDYSVQLHQIENADVIQGIIEAEIERRGLHLGEAIINNDRTFQQILDESSERSLLDRFLHSKKKGENNSPKEIARNYEEGFKTESEEPQIDISIGKNPKYEPLEINFRDYLKKVPEKNEEIKILKK